MRINWKDVFKFLSDAFFVTAGRAGIFRGIRLVFLSSDYLRCPRVFGNTRFHTLRTIFALPSTSASSRSLISK
jgi:hypothetical protein